MREYIVHGLTSQKHFSNFLRRGIVNGDVVQADPTLAEGIPWLVRPRDLASQPLAAAATFSKLSRAASKAVREHELTPAGALEVGVVGLVELGISKMSAAAIVKAAMAGNG